jgi:phage RecT family recombinase
MANEQTNGGGAVATREPSAQKTFRDQFTRMQSQIQAALPPQIPVERFMRVVLTAVNENPDLLYADRVSLLSAATKAAQDGLLPDTRDGALVVYNTKTKIADKETWIKKVQWMPMIGGLLKKARNSGEIKSIETHVVREGDRFLYVLGDNPRLEHEPDLDNEGDLRFAYAIAWLKNGSVIREVMTRRQAEQVRAVSKSKDGPAWKNWESEMWRKAVFRRLFKWLPHSADLDDLVRRDDELYDLNPKDSVERAAVTAAKAGLFQPVSNPLADEEDDLPDAAAASDSGRVDPETGEVIEVRQEPAPQAPQKPVGEVSENPPPDSGRPANSTTEARPSGAGPSNEPDELPSEPVGKTHVGKVAAAVAKPEPDPDALLAARKRGMEARRRGMPRSATPKEFKADAELLGSWLEGYTVAAQQIADDEAERDRLGGL